MTRQPIFSLLIFLTLCIGCCCPQKYDPCNTPPPLPAPPTINHPIRLALVLGGGGAKGLAHVGVIEELEKAGIPIDLIVGCSAGSIVGAVYADNPCASRLKHSLLHMRSNVLVDLDLWNCRYGLCQGKMLRRFLNRTLCADTFEELQIPFYLVTTDVYSCELVTIGGGPLVPAIEASCSIPLVFVPVQLHGRAFVDGGVIDPVPVCVAKHFNAEVIVAVDLSVMLAQTFPTNLFGVATRSAEINLLWQSERCVRDADVVIRPNLQGVGTFTDDKNEQIYHAGKVAAREAIPQILKLLEERAKGQLSLHPIDISNESDDDGDDDDDNLAQLMNES